jgi:hypothetical protein
MMRELTLANAMQNIRVTKYLYMAVSLGDGPWRFSCRCLYDQPKLRECELPHAGLEAQPSDPTEQLFRNKGAPQRFKGACNGSKLSSIFQRSPDLSAWRILAHARQAVLRSKRI